MSASTIITTKSSNGVLGCQPSVAVALLQVADQQIDFGGPEEPLVDHDVVFVVSPRCPKATAQNSRTLCVSPRADDVVVGFGSAAASATWHRRSRRRKPQSRFASRFPRASLGLRPSLIWAHRGLILRVTNSRPRRGLSWLNRMPDEACRS